MPTNITPLRTPSQAPRANATCERFLGSVRRECLGYLLILHEKQLQQVLNRYVAYFNRARPHQGIRQHLPEPPASPALSPHPSDRIIGIPILGGLHYDYQKVAERLKDKLAERWKAFELNITMDENISSCAFSAFEKPRSFYSLVIATHMSRLPNTRGIVRMKLLHEFDDKIVFSGRILFFRNQLE
jgi:hypothetical protein